MLLRKVGKILLYGCAGVLGTILLLMLAVKLALDRVPQYQSEIKDWVHSRIGYHVAFAHVSPAFRWYGPELYFERMELRSKDDRRVLARAAGGRIGADLWQLIRSGKLFAGRIELDSPDFTITRLGPDRFALASEIELGGADSTLPALRLDDLPAGTLAIRRGRIAIQDWNPELPRLELRDVNLNLRRGDDTLVLTAAANLPTVLGGEIRVAGSARGDGPADTLEWAARVRTRNLSLAGWRMLLPQYLGRLGGGGGGFEVTARGRGANLERADLDCNAAAVMVQLADEPSVRFEQLSGAFTLSHAADQWVLSGRRVRAREAGRRDPDSEFDVNWREGEGGLLELGARASYLRADTLLPLAGLLPQADLRERLQEVAPTGEWTNTRVSLMRSAAGSPWRLAIEARFRGVGFAAVGRAPGLRGLSGSIAGTESGGRVDIDAPTGVFQWPAQLERPIEFANFKTTLYWKRTAAEFLVATPAIEFKTRDAALQGRAAWRQPTEGDSPILTLDLGLHDGNAAQTRSYLPRALLHPKVLAWLNRAFVAGHLSHADIVFQGPVRHFPFRDGSGVFLARAHIEGMTLDYQDGWPRAENLAFVADFRNEGLTVELQNGGIGNMGFHQGELRFADFKTGEMQLHVAGSGDAADALDYLRASPLDAMADHAFSDTEAHGPVQAEVDLFLPFKAFDQRRVLVHAHLHGVSLKHAGGSLAATELSGDADVDGGNVARADLHGKVLGGSFQLQSRPPRSRPLNRTTMVFNGTFSGDALRAALSLPPSVSIAGTTDWHGILRMASEPQRERSLRINGSLAALDLNLPEPLAKPAGRSMPSTVEIQWPTSGGALVRLALGSVLRGQASIESGAQGPTLARAAVSFGSSSGEPAFSDTQTLNAGGRIDHLDLGGWLNLYAPDTPAKPAANFLRTAKFDVARIDYLGLSFLDVALDLSLTDTGWRIGVSGPNVVGSISLPSAESDPWKLEFKRLQFVAAPDEMPAAQQDAGHAANPRRIPALAFHAAEMTWGDRQFGDVRATLARLEDGIGLQDLKIGAANFTLDAKGEWRGREGTSGRIAGTFVSSDVGAALKQLGYDPVIEAKTGKMDFDLSWAGAPTAAAFSLSTGHVQMAFDKGQITGLKPGAGRVVGLASVAALPRRLALDFSDLTDKGFSFDTVRGDFELHDGSAFTDNVLVKGPAAEIGLIGRVGLKNKDYDQTAVVTGNVGSSLPLAAFAGGPVIGAAVLLFTQVFKQPLKGLARGYYRITGPWDNPTVERIKSADAAAAEAPK